MNDNAPAPTLIEPGVRYFLSKSLEQCRRAKDYYHTQTFNFTAGVVFFICLGIFLFIRYKGKPSPEEVEAKRRREQEYILLKIKNGKRHALRTKQRYTDGLPDSSCWERDGYAHKFTTLEESG